MKQPKTYIAPHPVYTGGVYYHAGEPFTTNDTKGAEWEPADPKERAAARAADKVVREDVNLDDLDVPALQALAASKGVNFGDAKSKADLITIIKAAAEPTL